MICSSSLADDLTTLVLDTSVLINLHACTFGEQILAAIPNAIVAAELVVQELGHETSQINGEHQFLERLIAQEQVQLVQLNDAAWVVFEKLTTTTPSLGDGEAATIAVAATSAFRPVIDDAKGRRSVEAFIGDEAAAWSLDLLLHPHVQKDLATGEFVDAVYLALREGRMRIDESRCDAVVELIGVERAMHCTSLPGFKLLRENWQED